MMPSFLNNVFNPRNDDEIQLENTSVYSTPVNSHPRLVNANPMTVARPARQFIINHPLETDMPFPLTNAPFNFQSPPPNPSHSNEIALPNTALQSPIQFVQRKRSRVPDEGEAKVRVVELTSKLETKHLAIANVRNSIAKRFSQQTSQVIELANQRAAEAERRADEATKMAQDMKKMLEEAAEVQKAETQKFREEMTRQAEEAILAAQGRAAEAEKKAEDRVRKSLQETSKLQQDLLVAMERFKSNPHPDTNQSGHRRPTITSDGDDDEVNEDNNPGSLALRDEDVAMSQPTLPDSSDTEPGDGGFESDCEGEAEVTKALHQNDEINDEMNSRKGKEREVQQPQVSFDSTFSPNVETGPTPQILPSNNVNMQRTSQQNNLRRDVPRPRNFRPPRGGAGPSIHINMPSSGDSNLRQPSPSPAPLPSIRRKPRAQPRGQSEAIFGENVEPVEPDIYRRRERIGGHKHRALAGMNPLNAKRLSAVRSAMNDLLHITKDDEIIDVECATEAEVLGYLNLVGDEPALDPMRPYLDNYKPNIWNNELFQLFVPYFEDREDIKLTEGDCDYDIVESMFFDRLKRLARKWREFLNLSEEVRAARRRKNNKRARANSRRVRLFDIRREICYGNMTNRDGSIDLGWQASCTMVEELGPAGMSSEESEVDEATKRTVYIVKKRAWRSKEILDRLKFIDSCNNTTNAYGEARPGNRPKERKRIPSAVHSKRAPVPKCPSNYYQREFVAGLHNRDRRLLKMEPARELGIIHGED